MPIQEFQLIVLNRDLPEMGLQAGDVGTVVHVYEGGRAFEVEFVSGEGETLGVVTLTAEEIPPFRRGEVLHVRPLATA